MLAVEAGGERLTTVRLDGAGGAVGAGAGQEGRNAGSQVVTFSVREYEHVDHGYAATIHKAQGVTVDRAHVLASEHMDWHAAYVALTGHRDGVALHWSAEALGDRAGCWSLGGSWAHSPVRWRVARAGDVFGMKGRQTLAQVVADAQPEWAVGAIVETAETKTRAQLHEQAQQRVAQDAARRQEQASRPQPTPRRGPSMGM